MIQPELLILLLRIAGFAAAPISVLFLFFGIRMAVLYPPVLLRTIVAANRPSLPLVVTTKEKLPNGRVVKRRRLRRAVDPHVEPAAQKELEQLLLAPACQLGNGWQGYVPEME